MYMPLGCHIVNKETFRGASSVLVLLLYAV